MTCGLYERVASTTGKTIRLVLVDPQPAHWTRIDDATCGTQWSPRHGSTVSTEHVTPERPTALDYIAAETSLAVEGQVSQETFDARKAECLACPRLRRHQADEVGFCGACGCGERDRARLAAIKLWMPQAKCPLGKWGFAKGTRSTARQAIAGAIVATANIVLGMASDATRGRVMRALQPAPRTPVPFREGAD